MAFFLKSSQKLDPTQLTLQAAVIYPVTSGFEFIDEGNYTNEISANDGHQASPHIARRIRLCSVAGNTVWSIVRISIAIAMVFEGSAEM